MNRPSRLRKNPVSRKLRILKRAILVFVPAALISLAVIYLLSRAQEGAARSIAVTTQEKLVEIASQRVAALLVSVSSDLRFLAAQQELRHLLADDSPEGRRQLQCAPCDDRTCSRESVQSAACVGSRSAALGRPDSLDSAPSAARCTGRHSQRR